MIYNAQDVQTGNATAQSSVINTVEGNGSVSTHIEVEANGEKKVLDTNAPGTYKISVRFDNNVNATKTSTIVNSKSPIATSTPTIIQRDKSSNLSLISSFIKRIELFLQGFKIL